MQHDTRTRLAVGSLAIAALLGFAACGDGGDNDDSTALQAEPAGDNTGVATIVVDGRGEAEGRPDLMTISLGVETTAATADEALARNNERAAALIETLKSSGVAPDDIQTSELSVWPDHDDEGNVRGYRVSNAVTATLRDIGAAGGLIDAAAGVAGDDIRMHGVSFSIDDTSELIAAARRDAVERAMDEARQLAEAAGVELGPIRSIDETDPDVEPPLYLGEADYAATSDGARVPVEQGTQELTLDVRLVFEIAA